MLVHLDTALERHLLQEVVGEASFRFCHTEIQSVLYTDLGTPQRRVFHRLAGEVMEQRAMPEPMRIAEELAYHFSEANEIEKSLVYTIQAARRSELAFANEAALSWYNQTLDLLDRLGLEKASEFQALRRSVHESLGEVLTRAGHYDEALEHYASALFKWLGREPGDADEGQEEDESEYAGEGDGQTPLPGSKRRPVSLWSRFRSIPRAASQRLAPSRPAGQSGCKWSAASAAW